MSLGGASKHTGYVAYKKVDVDSLTMLYFTTFSKLSKVKCILLSYGVRLNLVGHPSNRLIFIQIYEIR